MVFSTEARSYLTYPQVNYFIDKINHAKTHFCARDRGAIFLLNLSSRFLPHLWSEARMHTFPRSVTFEAYLAGLSVALFLATWENFRSLAAKEARSCFWLLRAQQIGEKCAY